MGHQAVEAKLTPLGRSWAAPWRLLGSSLAAPWRLLGDSWAAPGHQSAQEPPRVPRSRPKVLLARPRDAPRASRRAFGTGFSHEIGKQACRKAHGTNFAPFFVFRVLSRDGSDAHEASILMVFQHDHSMFASHERPHAGASEKQLFRFRKSNQGAPKPLPGASGRAKVEPK